MTAKISVVIPTHNRSTLVKRALDSVLQQTYPAWEILVVDDHSTENLNEALSTYPVNILKSTSRGVSAARNTAIRVTAGEYIAFLDSDDEWNPQKLEKQMECFQQNPSLSLVHCNEIWMRNNKRVPQLEKHQKSGGRIFEKCVEACVIGPSCTIVKSSLFKKYGLFDESFPVCEDFDLWLRISSQEEIGFIPEELVIKYGGHADQLSTQLHSMDLWRLRALAKHLESPHLTPNELRALHHSILNKGQIYLAGLKKHGSEYCKGEVLQYCERATI